MINGFMTLFKKIFSFIYTFLFLLHSRLISKSFMAKNLPDQEKYFYKSKSNPFYYGFIKYLSFYSLNNFNKNQLKKYINRYFFYFLKAVQYNHKLLDPFHIFLLENIKHNSSLLRESHLYQPTINSSIGFQDLYVLYKLNKKKYGTFVEFGATDGKTYSNTYRLEKEYEWNGFLSEPNKDFNRYLKINRKCTISNDLIYSKTGEIVDFSIFGESSPKEIIDKFESALLSGISKNLQKDKSSKYRGNQKLISLKTISLNDYFEKYNIPKDLDYLSIDTEGSEYEIIKNFDLSVFRPKIITIEHNQNKNKNNIFNYLTSHNYKLDYEDISDNDFWFYDARVFDVNE